MTDPNSPLEPVQVSALTRRAKHQIRARMRATRQAYPLPAIASRSAKICERLLEMPLLRDARGVALFTPIRERREVDLGPVDAELRALGKSLYYPFMDPRGASFRTGFRKVERPEDLARRGQVFSEPPRDAVEALRGDVDVVLVPALAVAADGHRIGYGLGYYDATLPDIVPPAIRVVVAFDFQLLGELPHESHDQRGDWVVTDTRALQIAESTRV